MKRLHFFAFFLFVIGPAAAQETVTGAKLKIGSGASTIGGTLNLGGGASAAELRFLEPSASGTNYSALKAQAQSANLTYLLPATAPTDGQLLTCLANGTMSWATGAGTGDALVANPLSQFAATTSSQFKGVINDENAPDGASSKVIMALGSLSIASGKTLTASNTVTLTATDGSTLAIGTGGTLGTGAYATIANYLPLAGGTMTGNLIFTDATYDIGASGATRPRDIFLSRNATIGSLTSGRVPIASTAGLLIDDADLTFATDTLTATKFAGNGASITAINGSSVATGTVANARLTTAMQTDFRTLTIDGGGSAITTGVKADLQIPFDCTIVAVTMLADQSGSAVIDVWKDSYANYPPTVADTITASAKPTITAATKSTDSTLSGWSTAITAGDTLRFNVDSASTITRVTLILKLTK